MPVTLENTKTKSKTSLRPDLKEDRRHSELVPRLRRDQSPDHRRARRRAGQPTRRRSVVAPQKQAADETRLRRRYQPQSEYQPRNYYGPRERRKPSSLQRFFRQFTLEKSFTLIGFATGILALILFSIDLAFAWPLKRASITFDVTFALSGVVMILMCWNVAKDQIRGRDRIPDRIGPKLL
ncbi:hypothetical protein SH528x_004010 [Novipirellula sp. SH528]|uniref:hypothetical protein n=1 Tax=Novipirellula sp. SH528 TaxID=3454466 RepID=UPI003FA09278